MRRRIDREFKLALFAIIHRKTFHQQGREPGSSTTSERMEGEKALEAIATFDRATNSLKHRVDEFFSDRIVATCIIVCRIFFPADKLLRME